MSAAADDRRYWLWAVALIGTITLARLAVLAFSQLQLGPEEAQYWSWSLDLDAGYFSKPPLIAWIIAGTTAVCGTGEACVRAGAPLLYLVAALLVFETGRVLYGARVGFWAAIGFTVMPGVTFSSGLITTDVPLLAFWAAGLLVLALMLKRQPGEARWLAALLGGAIGLAIMSKYAGAYFLLGLAVTALVDVRARRHMLGLNGLIMALVILICVAPNIWWNVTHGFATVGHTISNASPGSQHFNIGKMFEFLGAQFGIGGPVLMVAVALGLTLRRTRWPHATNDDLVMLSMSLPVTIAGLAIAFYSRANANWAAPAFVGLTIVGTAWLLRGVPFKWLRASLVIGVVVVAMLTTASLAPGLVDRIGMSNGLKLLRGWNTQAKAISTVAHEGGYQTLLIEDREDMASLLYFTRDQGLTLRMWVPVPGHPEDQYQMEHAYDGSPDRVLFITRTEDPKAITERFENAAKRDIVSTVIGNKYGEDVRRTFHMFELSGYRGR